MKYLLNSLVVALLMILGLSYAHAETISAIGSDGCKKLKGKDQQFILILKKGEPLPDALLRCANDAELQGATLTGLGALENPTLNYYNLSTKEYHDKTFPGIYELISLNGNVTQAKGKRIAHLHVALSNDQYEMMGGHLGKASVGIVAEITVTPLKGKLVKKLDEKTGLELIAANH